MLDFTSYSKLCFEFKLNGNAHKCNVRKLGLDLATELEELETKEKSIAKRMETILREEKERNPGLIIKTPFTPNLTAESEKYPDEEPSPDTTATTGEGLESQYVEDLSQESPRYPEYLDLGKQYAEITTRYIKAIVPELADITEIYNLTQDELYFLRVYLFNLAQERDAEAIAKLSPTQKKTEELSSKNPKSEQDSLFVSTEGSPTTKSID